MAFSQSFRKGQIPVNCSLCETDRPIKWKCIDCNILMCNHCKELVHSKFKNALEHKAIDIKDIGLHTEEIDFTNIKCIQHSLQSCCLFCKTCDFLVCPTCFAKDHKKHDLTEISEGYNMKIKRLKKEHGKTQSSNAESAIQIDQLQELVNEKNLKHSKVRKDIMDHKKVIKEQVEKYFNELSNKLDQNHENALSSLKSDLNAIDLFNTQTKNKTIEVQEFIQITDASKFFREVNKMETSLEIPIQEIKSSYISSPKFVPGNITQSNIGSLEDDENLFMEPNISLVINKEYQSDLKGITFIRPCIDNSYWICSTIESKLQKVKSDGAKLCKISQYEKEVFGIAVLSSNDVLLATGGPRLKQLTITTGKLTDTVYNVAPLTPSAIHITSGNKVVVGGKSNKLGRRAVFVMNEEGELETVYEHDKHNQPIFTYPRRITSTKNGNIFVVDCEPACSRGRVVVLEEGGHIINEYTGHPDISKDQPFKPRDIVATPKDNVVVSHQNDSSLYILNNQGHPMTYYNTNNIGIFYPCSLAFSSLGQLCIGCVMIQESNEKAKMYEVNISGF
ncbi:uncharacterized protein LOC127738595 [Mytilus californianus]|uniref:uncharacterized protein LOC127738595 n=1 Tax=Mytilus californianus TaxID=6549 RepID=UPI00224665D7|nr:uncharacterized protein LOC127738595 [Mytilus californianus]